MYSADMMREELRKKASRKKAEVLRRFFKTGPGEYGEGDVFLGVTVPEIRKIAKKGEKTPLPEIERLLRSPIHEERFLALVIMVERYKRTGPGERDILYRLYLKNTAYINNWDLVDVSAGRIVGEHLVRRAKRALRGLARSCDMWERRIAVIATSRFIGAGKLDEALDVIDMVIEDEEDLLHKACGWMLREIWKKDSGKAEEYIANNRERMARTTLRYAIEKVPEKKRKKVLLVGKNKAIRYRRENDA